MILTEMQMIQILYKAKFQSQDQFQLKKTTFNYQYPFLNNSVHFAKLRVQIRAVVCYNRAVK